MQCRYEDNFKSRGNFLAVIGTSMNIFEGHLLPDIPDEVCFYTKDEIEKMDLDVLEFLEVKDKYKGFQELVQMGIRWGWRVDDVAKMPYTHGERIKIANNFLENVRKIPYVYSAKIIGSLERNEDKLQSDIDIKITTDACPSEENCKIAQLLEDYILEPLDIYCNKKEKLE